MALQEEFEKQGNWLFIYRSYIPLFILGIFLFVFIQAETSSTNHLLFSRPYNIYYELLALLVSLLGLAIRIYTVGHTPKHTSGRNTKEGQVADSLNTSGIYSIVRHPLYLGNFLMWCGPAMMAKNLWFFISFVLFYWVYYERIMFAEEQFLRRKFGDAYLNWSKAVPAFIPNFKNFIKPNLQFSIKKVLKKEKNGLLALFLIFSVLNGMSEYIEKTYNYNYIYWGLTLLTSLLYIVLKILKNYTSILNEENR